MIRRIMILLTSMAWANAALACPFCDTGGEETAVYVVLVFGLFMVTAAFVLFAAIKSGLFKDTEGTAQRMLKSEQPITTSHPGKDTRHE